MAFDGIVTKSIVRELNHIIGFKVDKIYQPDKNTIILGLYGKNTNLALLACINSNYCRLHLTSHNQKKPLTAPNFCMLLRKHLIGFKIKEITTIDLERVVQIHLENKENPNKPVNKILWIELMGKHSNIILTDDHQIIIDSMRHTTVEEHASRDIYPTARYCFPKTRKYSFLELKDFEDFYGKIEPKLTEYISHQFEEIFNLDICNFELEKIISSTFNGISSSFVQHLIQNLSITTLSKDSLAIIYHEIEKVLSSSCLTIVSCQDEKDYYLSLTPIGTSEPFSLNYAIDDFYFRKESSELFKNYRNTIFHLILATLKKYEKRLEHMDSKLAECKNMDQYKLYGELITSNLYKIPHKNMSHIELENYYQNNELITIPLDEKYLPSYNAKKYFKKYTKLKNALEIVNQQKQETIQDINYIESVFYELEACKTIEDVEEIYEEILDNSIFSDKVKERKGNSKNRNQKKKAKSLTKNKLASFNPLKYVIDGYTILVGRNNKENDYLTCKFANKQDIWFHTKDIHGSHVILKTNPNEIVPDEILLEAAKLAVKHSKAKNSSHVPVDFCTVSFVKKPSRK